jgi:RHS repeat-associated protein
VDEPNSSTATVNSSGCPGTGEPIWVTTYTYNQRGDLMTVVQAGSRQRNFTYDSLSRLLTASNPESGLLTYTYDADGNTITKKGLSPNQGPTGTATVTTTYTYDALNRLTGKSYSDGYSQNNPTTGVQYAYDGNAPTACTPPGDADSYPVGHRTAMCDGSGATSWKHDQMGRVLQERRTIGTAVGQYDTDTYNLDGSPASVTILGYGVTYTYSGAARPLTAVHSSTKFVGSATYAPPGELAGMKLGVATGFAGIIVSNAYNKRLQPILLSAASPSGTVFSECFDYHLGVAVTGPAPCSFSASAAGDNGSLYQIVNNRDSTRTQNFIYDQLNRIQQGYSSGTQWGETFGPVATAPGVAPTTPGIDTGGNLVNRSGVTGKTNRELLSVSAGANNQLSGFGYDPAGNMTSNGSASYVYDDENRLIATAAYSYIYDGDGERVEKCTQGTKPGICATSATGTLYWRGSGGAPLAETDLSGNNQTTYIFLSGQRVARSDSAGGTHYYFSDQVGSHGVVENATGSACEQDVDFYPYGGQQNDYCGTQVAQHYKFTGKERDSESGLDNFGARYDASTMGRFMSPDPGNIGVDRLNPQSWNAYSYSLNNPLSLTDPTGLYVCEDSTECNSQNDQNFAKSLAEAQTAANNLTGDDKTAAQRAIDAYGAQGVDNGVNVRFDANIKESGAVTEVSGVANGNKSADNPTGQNINVTFKPGAVGGDFSGGLVAHEGVHVADGSDWVKSGFSASMNPTNNTTELNANHVQFNIGNAMLGALAGPNGTYTGTLFGGSVSWKKGDSFKMITPDLQRAIQKENGANDTKPAFTKGAVLQP